ncbi:MAG: sugar phosphate isomerase/epimerase family protein [Oscillospiraceae bacterium]
MPIGSYQRMRDLICCAKLPKYRLPKYPHLGFIPENPQDPIFVSFLCALRYLVEEYRKLGINLLFETGQETPAAIRVFGELDAENVGLNFDPANLLMYGKANPVDALDMVGRYVKGVHGKDGEYPTNGKELGREMPMGQGRVDFPRFVAKLKEVGYNGAITIEREIAGDQQLQDVLAAKAMLEGIIEKLG